MNIAFIGGGNMATALIRGLAGMPELASRVRVSDPSVEARARLEEVTGVTCFETAGEAVPGADVVVLAVKPQVMPVALADLAQALSDEPLVISVAAGVTTGTLRSVLGPAVPLVRAMPNTPALLGAGITGLFADPDCAPTHRDTAESIMRAVGETVWVERESLMDVVTAISGSGPAYFYLLAETLGAAGEFLGLPAEVADALARHTAHGAGIMALNGDARLDELRWQVTSTGGTTEAALDVLLAGGFGPLIEAAVEAAARRGRELSRGAPS